MSYRDADFAHMRPSQEEVAALLYDRVMREYGQAEVEFTDTTTPTVSQVDSIIDQATGQLLDRVGVPIKDSQLRRGKWLATVYAASQITQEHIPEQTTDNPVYTNLIGEYTAQIMDFIESNRQPYPIALG